MNKWIILGDLYNNILEDCKNEKKPTLNVDVTKHIQTIQNLLVDFIDSTTSRELSFTFIINSLFISNDEVDLKLDIEGRVEEIIEKLNIELNENIKSIVIEYLCQMVKDIVTIYPTIYNFKYALPVDITSLKGKVIIKLTLTN